MRTKVVGLASATQAATAAEDAAIEHEHRDGMVRARRSHWRQSRERLGRRVPQLCTARAFFSARRATATRHSHWARHGQETEASPCARRAPSSSRYNLHRVNGLQRVAMTGDVASCSAAERTWGHNSLRIRERLRVGLPPEHGHAPVR